MHNKDFKGKIALVTGASRGLGRALAIALGHRGAHVICIARTVGGLEETDDLVKQAGGSATLMPIDLSKTQELDALGPTIAQRFDHIDLFVGNAAMLNTLSPVTHADPSEWDKVLNINLNANFRLIRTLDPLLQNAPSPRALFVSTGKSVIDGRAYWGAYGVSKAALETLVRTYAAENEQTNLKVNIVNPGAVRTQMREKAKPGEDPDTLPSPDEIALKFLPYLLETYTKSGGRIELQ